MIQKNGVLNQIAENGHLFEFVIDHFRDPPIKFNKIGINNAFAFKCYCSRHDCEIFRPIEEGGIDHHNNNHNALHFLRTCLNERYRKQIQLEYFESLVSAQIDRSLGEHFNESILGFEQGLEDMNFIIDELMTCLESNDCPFVFFSAKISISNVCLSSIFTFEDDLDFLERANGDSLRRDLQPRNMLISLYPIDDSTSIVVVGVHKADSSNAEDLIDRIFSSDVLEQQRIISNLMLFSCENWVVSPSFYQKFISPVESIVLSKMSRLALSPRLNLEEDINLFVDSPL